MDRVHSYRAIKDTKVSPAEFIKYAEFAFNTFSWVSNYGGHAWADICSGWQRLYKAKKENDIIVAIDHIYDLQHNTDSVFDKVKSYYQEQKGYRWIAKALDFKANLKHPYEFFGNVSSTLKPLALRILKSEGYESLEQYYKENIKKPRKFEKITAAPPKSINEILNNYKKYAISTKNMEEVKTVFNNIKLRKNYINDYAMEYAKHNFSTKFNTTIYFIIKNKTIDDIMEYQHFTAIDDYESIPVIPFSDWYKKTKENSSEDVKIQNKKPIPIKKSKNEYVVEINSLKEFKDLLAYFGKNLFNFPQSAKDVEQNKTIRVIISDGSLTSIYPPYTEGYKKFKNIYSFDEWINMMNPNQI